jgi:hypothetical protein
MRLVTCLRLAALTVAVLSFPALAAAQGSVKCESNDGHRSYCGNYEFNQVRLDRQISNSPCIQGRSWGVDNRGLWVDDGCRAYFTILRNPNGGGNWNGGEPGRGQDSVRCESIDGRRSYCGNYGYDQVRLERQISDSPCVQGRSWGVDRGGLWVDDGCRAVFEIRGPGQGGGHGPGRPDNHDSPWWGPDPSPTWPPRGDWHGGNWGSGGACFYKDRNFSGNYFCMHRGEERESLGQYGNEISSIRVFGGAHVEIYDDRNFSGARKSLHKDISDLHQLAVNQQPGHSWNDRISSVRIQ